MTRSRLRAEPLRQRLAAWWADTWRWVLAAVGAVVATLLLLRTGGDDPLLATALAALVVGAALTASVPMAIALMSVPALFVVERIGWSGVDLAVSDAALAAGFGTAVLLATRPFSRELRLLLLFNGVYQFATLITVVVNPYQQNAVEWFHAWLLISGALVLGWALGRAGYARLAFRLLVGAACVIAVGTLIAAVIQYAHADFGAVYPTWPFAMHKNFAGCAMAFAALVVYVNPPWAAFTRRSAILLLGLLGLAILATQSRQALVGLLVAVILVVSRRRVLGHSRLAFLLIIPTAWLVYLSVQEQIDSQNRFNSFFQRLDWIREVYAYWKHAPLFGHGLRFWYVDPTVPYQPPQAELEVAASAGIVGLAAFAVMWIGIILVLWRMDPLYGTLAVAAVASRLVQAQFDLFWVTAQVSIPFVIAGVCLGAAARAGTDAAGAPIDVVPDHIRRRTPASTS